MKNEEQNQLQQNNLADTLKGLFDEIDKLHGEAIKAIIKEHQ